MICKERVKSPIKVLKVRAVERGKKRMSSCGKEIPVNYAIHPGGGKQLFLTFVEVDLIVAAVVRLNNLKRMNAFGMTLQKDRFKSF